LEKNMARNVAHTSASRSVDGANQGKNDVMVRGSSVIANPGDGPPGGSQKATVRHDSPKYGNMTGGYGEISARQTPRQQYGQTGAIEPNVDPQPNLRGNNP
jgi:hypothetical protein